MEKAKYTDVLKIRDAVARARESGMDISEYTLRRAIRSGPLPCRIVGRTYRAVTISQQAIEVLKQQKAKAHDQYVFPSPKVGPISPDSVNNMLKDLRPGYGAILVYMTYEKYRNI